MPAPKRPDTQSTSPTVRSVGGSGLSRGAVDRLIQYEHAQELMALRTFVAPEPVHPIERGSAPSFSIIIPAYQAAEVITDAVESALAQTLPPHEVIVCDDGSTDDLRGALAPYAGEITLLHKEHGGVAGTRNVAIRAATGDFVASLDSDNKLLPEY